MKMVSARRMPEGYTADRQTDGMREQQQQKQRGRLVWLRASGWEPVCCVCGVCESQCSGHPGVGVYASAG